MADFYFGVNFTLQNKVNLTSYFLNYLIIKLNLGGFKYIQAHRHSQAASLRESQGPDVCAPLPSVGQGGPHLPFALIPNSL